MLLKAKDGLRGEFRRADTDQIVRFVRWYDDATNEWEAFRCDPAIAKERGISLRSILYRGRCRLNFKAAVPAAAKPMGRVAPSTPLDEIRRDVLKGGEIQIRRLLWIPGGMPECDEPKCHRRAEYGVAREQLVEPERGPDGRLYERAVLVDVGVYCPWHYRYPTQISQRGVESEVEVGTRPQ